jgi:hypothetical protein
MNVLLGPDAVTHGMDPATAIIGFSGGDMAILGPAVGPSTYVDPISHLFVVLGKLLAVRRVLSPSQPNTVDFDTSTPHPVNEFGAVQEAILDFDRTAEFDVIWKPLAQSIQRNAIDPLQRQAGDLDQRTRRFIAGETHAVLALDPTASVEERMASLDTYLRDRAYTVERSSDGFRDFIARSFSTPDGKRIDLPTSTNPSFPDSWITPVPVDPQAHGGSRREWAILL